MEETAASIKRLLHFRVQTDLLLSLCVCPTCLLRIAGETVPQTIRSARAVVTAFIAAADNSSLEKAENGDGTVYPVCCPCCFGLLQNQFCNPEFLQSILDHVKEEEYAMNAFWCSLTLPSSAEVRMRSFDEYWDKETSGDLAQKVPCRLSVKDAWKAIVTPVLTSGFAARWVGHEGLEVNIEISHPDMEDECNILKKRFPKSFQEKRGPDGKVKRTITRHALEKLMQTMTSNEFRSLIPFPPKPLLSPAKLIQIVCLPCSLYFGGRYLKFSRNISQSPWFIEEERKGEGSVEELICTKICDKFKAQSARFMASGREDIDVRCLGDGRPFAVEMLGAKIAVISEGDLIELESDINFCTTDIEIRYLETVTKNDMAVIKTGEEEKTKTYSALCQITEGTMTAEDCDLLNSKKELVILQKTPIRVLHRRANAERKRMVHEVSVVVLEQPSQFRLNIKTQAGTYVKEFIHGDFGRTEPSITSLLGKEVECEELDVTCVDLKWPPSHII